MGIWRRRRKLSCAIGTLAAIAVAAGGVATAGAAPPWTLGSVLSDPGGVATMYPAGAVAGPDHTVYVASSGSDDIVKITPGGTPQRMHIAGLDKPRDIAIDNSGRLLILDTRNNGLVIASTSGAVLKSYRPGLKSAFGVSSDGGGIYIADTYHHRVIKLNPSTGAQLWSQTGCQGALSRPRDVAVGGDGLVYVADTDHNRIAALNPETGACVRSFGSGGGGNGQFQGPRSIASDGDGGLYVAEAFGKRVQHVSTTGRFISTSPHGSPSLRAPACVYVDGPVIGVCDTFEYQIHLYKESGTAITETGKIAGPRPAPGGFNQPFGVAYAPGGSMFVTDMFNHRVQKFNANGTFALQFGGFGTAPTSFTFPRGIAVTPDGSRVVVTDSENDRICYYTSNGVLQQCFRPKGDRTGWPHQTAVAKDGSLWIADTYKNRVLHLSSTGTVLGQFTGGGKILLPRGIAVDAAGAIYLANSGRNQIEKYDAGGRLLAVLATSGTGATSVRTPWNIALGPGRNGASWLYIADGDNDRILILTTTGAPVGTIGTGAAGAGRFDSPRGVSVNPATGVVAATDFYGNDVTTWRP